jgi:hypothetical protein
MLRLSAPAADATADAIVAPMAIPTATRVILRFTLTLDAAALLIARNLMQVAPSFQTMTLTKGILPGFTAC